MVRIGGRNGYIRVRSGEEWPQLHFGPILGAVQQTLMRRTIASSSGGHLIHMTGCEAGPAAQPARMAFERQGSAAKGAFGQQPSDDPMAMPASGAVIMLIDAVHDVVTAQKWIERGFMRSFLGNIGMHALVPPFRTCNR